MRIFDRLFGPESLLKCIAFTLLALLLIASPPAQAQPLGAPNSFQSQIGGQTKDHVDFTGGTISGVAITGGSSTSQALTTPTITNPTVTTGTFTTPAITGGTISGATISGAINSNIVRTSAALTKNASAAYANITGLSQTVVPGTYKFSLMLPSTVASGTGGIKYAFNYTTAVLSSMEATARGYTASAVAVQHTTTATTQADLFSQAAVVIFVQVEGTMVVSTGGTVDVQMAQNTANASDTIALVGGSFQLTRIS